jgi:hypothetical protein
MLKLLKKVDLFGVPITIFHKKERAYRSKVGGCITIWFIFCMITYAGFKMAALVNREGDTITMGSLYYSSIEDQLIYPLKHNLRFQISINDPTFRNENSSFIEFKLHYYTNIDNDDPYKEPMKEFQDIIVPLEDCNKNKYNQDTVWTSSRIISYCPTFTEKHMLLGGYYAAKQAWFRLGIHRCDPTKRKCVSREEQDKYVRRHLIY